MSVVASCTVFRVAEVVMHSPHPLESLVTPDEMVVQRRPGMNGQ